MKTIVFLSFLFFASLVSLIAGEEKDSVSKVARNTTAEKSLPQQKDAPARFKIDIIPTFGPSGSRRPPTFIEGEFPCFTFSITDLAGKGDLESHLKIEILDEHGNKITDYSQMSLSQDAFIFGGSSYSGSFAIDPTKAGKFAVKLHLIHQSSGKSEIQEFPFEVLPKETFGAINVRFSHDNEGHSTCGANLSVGDNVYIFTEVNGYSIKDKRVHLKETLILLDENKNPLLADKKLQFDFDKEIPENYQGKPRLNFNFYPSRPGNFFARIEIKDCIDDKTVTYDLPFKVFLPPALDEEKR